MLSIFKVIIKYSIFLYTYASTSNSKCHVLTSIVYEKYSIVFENALNSFKRYERMRTDALYISKKINMIGKQNEWRSFHNVYIRQQ